MIIHHHNKFFFTIIALTVVCCYTTLVVLWDRYGLVCLIHWHVWRHETPHQKILRTFVMPARTHCAYTRLLSWVSRVGWVTHVKYAAHASENASHVATLALDVPFPGLMFFFFYYLYLTWYRASPASRDRVINAPCDPSAPRFLAARAGLHFGHFF
jgi:hypothetical protein